MKKEIVLLKEVDWSINLEDEYYVTHVEELLQESIDAVRQTKEGHYVNLVTPGDCGDPRDWLIQQLSSRLQEAGISIREIRYIDECGCGGYVTRVFRN